MVPTTPGTNRKNLVVLKAALPTPSFSQQLASASKRKREGDEELDNYPLQLRHNKSSLMKISLDVFEEPSDKQWLLSSGDLVQLQAQRLRLHSRVLFPLGNSNTATADGGELSTHIDSPVLVIDSPLNVSEVTFVDILADSKVLVMATNSGAFAFWTLPDMQNLSNAFTVVRNNVAVINNPQVLVYHLEMLEEGEELKHLRTQGKKVLALTTRGNVFVLSHSASDVSAYNLQRNVGVVAGLLQAGAKLFGIGSQKKTEKDYIATCSIPHSSQLLCVGSDLTLWNTSEPAGEEKALYDLELGKELREDLTRATAKDPRILVLDASIMECAAHAEVVTLLLLVASSSMHSLGATNSTLPVTLWLYTVEVPLVAEEKTLGESAINVKYRMKIAENVKMVCESGMEAQLCNAKMFSMPPSWRVFVTWTNATSNTIMATQIDVLNQKLPEGELADRYVVDGEHGVDTELAVSHVVAANAVQGTDGVCVLDAAAEQLAVLCPRLPVQFTKTTAAMSSSPNKLSIVLEKDKIVEILLSLAFGQETVLRVSGDLRNAFSAWPMADIVDAVSQASLRVIDQSATGRFWGSSTTYQHRAESNKTNAFQLAHRLVNEKVQCHQQLMDAVNHADGTRYDEVTKMLQEHHQKLLLSAGLSEALQDCQYKLESISEADDTTGYKLAIDSISHGIVYAIQKQHKISLDDLEAKGLSAFDQFYGDVSKILEGVYLIVEYICQRDRSFSVSSASNRNTHAIYAVISILLSAVQRALEGQGQNKHTSFHLLHQAQLRHAFLLLSKTLLQHIHHNPMAQHWEEREGRRLLEFADIFLGGYVSELDVIGEQEVVAATEQQSQDWQEEFQHAKEFTLETLLALGYSHEVFDLSERYLYFLGLFHATQMSPAMLYPRLERDMATMGHVQGSDTLPLASKCFEWLYEQHRFSDILSIGRQCEDLLALFLKTRPHLAWMHHIRQKEYDQATHSGLQHAQQMAHKAPSNMTKSLLSIAKLSAHVHQQKHQITTTLPKPAFMQTPGGSAKKRVSSKEGVIAEQDVNRAVDEIQTDLMLMKFEEDLQAEIPSYVEKVSVEKDQRVFDFIQGSIRALTSQDSQLDPERLARIPTTVIGMLNIAKKRIGEGIYSSGFASAIPQLAQEVWTAVLQLDGDAWVMMSPKSEELEKDLRATVLFQTLDLLKHDILQKLLLKELIPITAEQIEEIIGKTDLTKKELDRDGNIKIIKGNGVNKMVPNRIKACIDLALDVKASPNSPLAGSPRSPLPAGRSPLPNFNF